MTPDRYAVYVVPDETAPWAQFCTAWLGWDVVTGEPVKHPELPGLNGPVSAVTAVPRRYGLHATIKPPFRLAAGKSRAALERSVAELSRRLAPVSLDGLALSRLGRFLALTADGSTRQLDDMAREVVMALDAFRAPPTAQELERRRAAALTPAQDQNLTRWGYPYVMDSFRFHITLTGKLPKEELAATEAVLAAQLSELLPRPFRIGDLALVGEDSEGVFHLLGRYPLSGPIQH